METSGFFNAMENADGSYDRTYIAEQFAKFFSMFIGNGVFASPQNQLKVIAKENLTVVIQKGFAFIDGYWYYNDSDLEVDVTPNATANKRVDGIFITLDKTERTITHTYEVGRANRIVNGSVSELKIAEVTVEVGVAVLSDAKIKDTRADNNVCGFVTGIIDVIETDDLFLQFETQFTEWFNSLDNEGKKILSDFITESDALLESFTNDKDEALNNFSVEINEWFESIKGKMSEDDIAVSLQLQVDDLRADTDENTLKIGNLMEQVDLFDIIMSTDYTLYNSKKGGYRLNELVGATEQKTMSGKNKFNYDKWKGTACERGTAVYENNGVTITANGADAYTYMNNLTRVDVTEGDIVKLSWEETTNTSGLIYIFPNGVSSKGVNINNATRKYLEYTVESGVTYITFRFGVVAPGTTISYKNIMITVNDDDPTFEPWCGGTPSPNPSFQQAIENTFDCVEMIVGGHNTTTGAYASSYTSYICNKHSIPCKASDTIKVEVEDEQIGYIWILWYGDSGYISNNKVNANIGEFVSPSNAKYFNINVGQIASINPQTVGKITLTVKGKHVGQFVDHGKNICGGDKLADLMARVVGLAKNGTNKTVTYHASTFSGKSFLQDYDWKENTPYTIMFYGIHSNNSGEVNLCVSYTDGTSSGRLKFISNLNESYCRFVTEQGKTVKAISGYYQSGSTTLYYEKCGIFEGVVALEDFEPYTEKVTTFYLNEPLRATDSIVRKDGVIGENRKRNTIVLDGTASIGVVTALENVVRIGINIPDKQSISKANGTCNSLPFNSGYNTDSEHFYVNGTRIYLFLDKTRLTSVDATGVDEYLNTNPITVEYELAEETFTPLDTASQLALNDMETFDGVTYIEVDSKIPPTSISGEYGASEVSALSLENANLRDSEAILEKERNVVRRLSGVNLSSINGYTKAYCVDCTDIPVLDEGTNEGFYEQWQNDYGINMERYTVLNESGYGVGIYTRANSVSWQKVGADPVIEFESRIQYVDVDVTGGQMFYKVTPPIGFTIHNSVIIAYDHIRNDSEIYHNSMIGIDVTDASNTKNFPTHAVFRKNTTTGSYTLNTNLLGAISCNLEGTLRVYFLKYR